MELQGQKEPPPLPSTDQNKPGMKVTPPPVYTKQPSNVNKQQQQQCIKDDLQAASDKVAYLVCLMHQHSSTCILHLESNHPLRTCRVLESICKECIASGYLKQAKEKYACTHDRTCQPNPVPAPAPRPAPTLETVCLA